MTADASEADRMIRWVVVIESQIGLDPAHTKPYMHTRVVEAPNAMEAAEMGIRQCSVAALRRGVEVEVFRVGRGVGRWEGRYEKPDAHIWALNKINIVGANPDAIWAGIMTLYSAAFVAANLLTRIADTQPGLNDRAVTEIRATVDGLRGGMEEESALAVEITEAMEKRATVALANVVREEYGLPPLTEESKIEARWHKMARAALTAALSDPKEGE